MGYTGNEDQDGLTGCDLEFLQAAAPSTSRSRLVLTAVTPPLRPASVRTPSLFTNTVFDRCRLNEVDHGVGYWDVMAYEFLFWNIVNWGEKAKRRKTTGSGRMSHLKDVHQRYKNGFRVGVPKGARGPEIAQ